MSITRTERLRRTREESGLSLSLNQLQVVLALSGILAVLALAFTLGAVWGRGSTRVVQMGIGDNIGIIPGASELEAYKDEFTFYQTLSDKKTDPEKSPDLKAAVVSSKSQEIPAAKENKTSLVRADSEKVGGVGSYTIQVGSFRSKENADSLSSGLTSKGYTTDIYIQNLEDEVWYRVRVGSYLTKKEAEEAGERLKSIDKLVAGYLVTKR